MTALPTLPDTEGAVIRHLRGDTEVTALGHISPRIVEPWPCLHVTRIGGVADLSAALDSALIQMDAWGAPEDSTTATAVALKSLLATAEMSLRWRCKGSPVNGLVVTRVRLITRVQSLPDPQTGQQRYLTRLQVSARTT